MKKVYQYGTNLLKVHNGNSFANLHPGLKLGLLHHQLQLNLNINRTISLAIEMTIEHQG